MARLEDIPEIPEGQRDLKLQIEYEVIAGRERDPETLYLTPESRRDSFASKHELVAQGNSSYTNIRFIPLADIRRITILPRI